MDRKEIEKLAELARLDLSDEEAAALAGDIDAILRYVSEIQEVAESDEAVALTEPYNVARKDGEPHETGKYTDVLLKEAPSREGDYIKVKRTIQHGR